MNASQDARSVDADRASPTARDAYSARRRASAKHHRRPAPRATFRSLTVRGFAPREAGNLTAYVAGLRPTEQGWTLAEVSRLLFVRYLVERGWLGS